MIVEYDFHWRFSSFFLHGIWMERSIIQIPDYESPDFHLSNHNHNHGRVIIQRCIWRFIWKALIFT